MAGVENTNDIPTESGSSSVVSGSFRQKCVGPNRATSNVARLLVFIFSSKMFIRVRCVFCLNRRPLGH